jgi:hypothetical protein
VLAVLALVVGVGVGVDAHASSSGGQVAGTRVAAHELLAGPVVAASEDIAAGEGRRTTTRAADVATGLRVAPRAVAGSGDGVLRHYTDDVGRVGIESSGAIRPGADGRVYVTPTRYSGGAQAQAELALGRTPTGYFEVPRARLPGLQGPRRVDPWAGQPGGGVECWVTCSVEAEGLKWFPFAP